MTPTYFFFVYDHGYHYHRHSPYHRHSHYHRHYHYRTNSLLGGSWAVLSGVISPPNMGYNYSYPTYNPTYNLPLNPKP